jgi:hypothetical protein
VIKIGDYSYTISTPPAMRTFALQQRIAPVLGRVIGVVMQIAGKVDIKELGDKDVAEALPLAAPALGEIFAAMPEGELEALTKELLRDVTVSGWGGAQNVQLFNGTGGAFDSVFQGKSLEVWQLLWHALKVWYPDFFSRVAVLRGGARKESGSKDSST